MDRMQIFSLAVIIAGMAIVIMNALALVFPWPVIPTNVFIIGLGLAVIGLVLFWNSRREWTLTSW
jgi:hypothetical protein